MKRTVSILLGLAILALIYWQIDVRRIGQVLAAMNYYWLGAGLCLFLPLIATIAWRMQIMLPGEKRMPFADAFGLILAGQVLNIVLPSKMGDIAKLFFIEKRGYASRGLAFALVVFERICDILALLFWGLCGLLLLPQRTELHATLAILIGIGLVGGTAVLASRRLALLLFELPARLLPARFAEKAAKFREAWLVMQTYFWEHPVRAILILVWSLVNWFFNLGQVWLFALAIGSVSLLVNLALAPLAIFTGLLPFTFAGIGTRDAAIIYFYEPYLGADGGAALGLLTSLRYFVPALLGLPFFMKYLGEMPANLRTAEPPDSTPGKDSGGETSAR